MSTIRGETTKVNTPQNLPYSGVTKFVGRQEALTTLHEQLQHNQCVAISAIAGMGGIGKTELALQYALKHLNENTYPGGECWLRAQQDVATQIVDFAIKLGLKIPEELKLPQQVAWCWQHWREGLVLIVYDDVQKYEDIQPYLPPVDRRFKVLLTTRLDLPSPVQKLTLKVLTEEASLYLLRSIVTDGRIDRELEVAKNICEWLGYLPLGLELAGRYLLCRKDLSLTKLWERLQEKRLKAQALIKAVSEMTAQLGIAAAFELSLQMLDSSIPELRTFKVLSIDGGGIKGLYSSKILERFEEKFNCHIVDYFDLICGTSTGGLIALGLSLKIPARKISNLYYSQGKKIFPQQNKFISCFRQFFIKSKHDNKELKTALENMFGNRTLTDSHCLLCIPTFSLTDGRPFIFKYDHPEGHLSRDNKAKYVDIGLATSAAPTYLPIVTLDSYDRKQFIDGGIYANNPTLIGIVEALRYFVGNQKKFQKLMVMSIGSLETNPGRRFIKKYHRSVINWNKDLISTFFEGQAALTDYFVETLSTYCDSPFDYIRIPGASLSPEQAQIINMDNTSTEALNLMSQKGNAEALLWEKKLEVAQFFETRKSYIIK